MSLRAKNLKKRALYELILRHSHRKWLEKLARSLHRSRNLSKNSTPPS